MISDIRYAVRTLIRSPGFTLVAAATLALGIGANTAIFSVVDAILLRPLPYAAPQRLVRVYDVSRLGGTDYGTFSPQDFDDLDPAHHTYSSLAAYWFVPGLTAMTLTAQGEPARLSAAYVSAEFFSTLGLSAARGRVLRPDENVRGRDREVVLGNALWRSRFGADPAVVGRTIRLDDEPFTVVGVLPPTFTFPTREAGVYVPLSLIGDDMVPHRRGIRWLEVVGRLAPGVTPATAQRATSRVLAGLERAYPGSNEGWGAARVLSLHDALVGDVRPALAALLGVVAFVLLIACANLANLLLVRGTGRARELAVRVSLGASPMRLVRQVLTESVVLSLAAGLLGLGLAWWGVHALVGLGHAEIPRAAEVSVDGRVAFFALALSLGTGLLVGLVPALRSSDLGAQRTLRESGRGAGDGRRQRRARGTLVVAEIAVAVVVLAGAGLMLRSFWKLSHVDPGFHAGNVLALRVAAPRRLQTRDDIGHFHRGVLERLRSVPGVVSAAGSKSLPLSGGGEPYEFTIPGRPAASSTFKPEAGAEIITPGYFRTLGIPLLEGRDFTERDAPPNAPVVIVNRALARKYWPGQDAVGQEFRIGGTLITVIGVAADVKNEGLASAPAGAVYVPAAFFPRTTMNLFLRTRGEPLALAGAVRRALHEVDPALPVGNLAALRTIVAESIAQPRFFTWLVAVFGALALSLAVVGTYGVMAYSVRQRRGEIGVRMALGARSVDVLRLVLAEALRLSIAGVALGVAGALALTHLLGGLLYGVGATDPLTFLVVPLMLIGAATAAALVPAVRAVAVDAMEALRIE